MSENLDIVKSTDVIDDDHEYLFRVLGECTKWDDIHFELSQNRSDFQIEKFILHDTYTLPSAFKAALVNRRSVAENLMNEILDAKRRAREFHYKWDGKDKSQPIWWKCRGGGEELCWYDLDEFQFNQFMESLNLGFKSAIEELSFFDRLIERLIEINGGPVTRQQYVEDQPTYWHRRLSSQALDDLQERHTGINGGNIRSMRRASSPTILENDLNRVKESFGDPSNVGKMLEQLQKTVAEGITEICGLEKILSGDESQTQKLNDSNSKPKSLFNQSLKS